MVKWVKIFHSKAETFEKLPFDRIFTVSINGLIVCIYRKEEGFFAFKNFCPHSGGSLSDGFINSSSEIVCPLHGYRFSLWDGKEKSGHSCELSLYATSLREDGFYLGLK